MMKRDGKETVGEGVADFGWPQQDQPPQEHQIGETGFRFSVNACR